MGALPSSTSPPPMLPVCHSECLLPPPSPRLCTPSPTMEERVKQMAEEEVIDSLLFPNEAEQKLTLHYLRSLQAFELGRHIEKDNLALKKLEYAVGVLLAPNQAFLNLIHLGRQSFAQLRSVIWDLRHLQALQPITLDFSYDAFPPFIMPLWYFQQEQVRQAWEKFAANHRAKLPHLFCHTCLAHGPVTASYLIVRELDVHSKQQDLDQSPIFVCKLKLLS